MDKTANARVMREIAAPIDDVWRIVESPGALYRDVSPVHETELIRAESRPRLRVTAWLKGFVMSWVEEHSADADKRALTIRQVEGMFASYEATIQLHRTDHGTLLDIGVAVNTGMPYLEAITNPVLVDAYADLLGQVLAALDDKLSAALGAPALAASA